MPWMVAGSSVVADLELAPELRVALPYALHAQALARLRPEQVAHDRGQVGAPARGDAGDSVAVLLVSVRDALEDGFQGGERDGRGRDHKDSVTPMAPPSPWQGDVARLTIPRATRVPLRSRAG